MLVHEGGFTLKRFGDEHVFFDRRGRGIDAVPPLGPLADLPEDIDPGANFPRWDGSRLDLGGAIDGLFPMPDDPPEEPDEDGPP